MACTLLRDSVKRSYRRRASVGGAAIAAAASSSERPVQALPRNLLNPWSEAPTGRRPAPVASERYVDHAYPVDEGIDGPAHARIFERRRAAGETLPSQRHRVSTPKRGCATNERRHGGAMPATCRSPLASPETSSSLRHDGYDGSLARWAAQRVGEFFDTSKSLDGGSLLTI